MDLSAALVMKVGKINCSLLFPLNTLGARGLHAHGIPQNWIPGVEGGLGKPRKAMFIKQKWPCRE